MNLEPNVEKATQIHWTVVLKLLPLAYHFTATTLVFASFFHNRGCTLLQLALINYQIRILSSLKTMLVVIWVLFMGSSMESFYCIVLHHQDVCTKSLMTCHCCICWATFYNVLHDIQSMLIWCGCDRVKVKVSLMALPRKMLHFLTPFVNNSGCNSE